MCAAAVRGAAAAVRMNVAGWTFHTLQEQEWSAVGIQDALESAPVPRTEKKRGMRAVCIGIALAAVLVVSLGVGVAASPSDSSGAARGLYGFSGGGAGALAASGFRAAHNASRPAERPAWRSACAQEARRGAALARVSLNQTCSGMDECLARLKRTIYARETLRNRVRLVPVDESAFDVCTELGNATFCELGYGEGGALAKRACHAPSACYRFDLRVVLEWAESMAAAAKSRDACSLVMRGHTAACSGLPRGEGHVVAHGDYGWRDALRLRLYMWRHRRFHEMTGTGGDRLLTYAMTTCKRLDVHAAGAYSNGTDLVYQHYDGASISGTCTAECWRGDARLAGETTEDREFFRAHSAQVCRPAAFCDAPQPGAPAAENQVDLFVKTELALHMLHAFGIINWYL